MYSPLYVASAAYATNAGTASTAVNALKLGGYEASEYLRKDEVQTLTAAYQEIEWTTPGTYNWVVPGGVNSILVTTVGGGGGSNYVRFRNYPVAETATNAYFHMFSGGGGGEVTPNVVVKVTPGETLQIVVGAGGNNAVPTDIFYITPTMSNQYSNTPGTSGGSSYIVRNGAAIAGTNANGGGGAAAGYYQGINSGGYDTYIVYSGTQGGNNSSVGCAAFFSLIDSYYQPYMELGGIRGGYKDSIQGVSSSASFYYGALDINKKPVAHGEYRCAGGGASWGNGAGKGQNAGIGGGGALSEGYLSYAPGDGMVKILAIGLTSD